MKIILYIASFFAFPILAFGQSDISKLTEPIVREGKILYRSEMASWYGTDLFMEKYKETQKIGGYFSYTDSSISKCIFFSRNDTPIVIGTITFDSSYSVETAIVDLQERDLTEIEFNLYKIRQLSLEIIQKDTLFKLYNKTNFNIIPLINNGERKVYVLTGPKEHGVVILGNDYLLTFDDENRLVSKKQLHKNIIPIAYNTSKADENGIDGAAHTHLPETGDFITATDICTLMLYEKFANWNQHSVVSKNYISIWNCKKDILIVVPTDVMNKANKDKK